MTKNKKERSGVLKRRCPCGQTGIYDSHRTPHRIVQARLYKAGEDEESEAEESATYEVGEEVMRQLLKGRNASLRSFHNSPKNLSC
jgi:hypothetical protein